MKYSKKLFLVILTLLFLACSSGGDDSPPNDGSGDTDSAVTSIAIFSNSESYYTGQAAFFVVRDQNNNVITDQASIFVNDTPVTVNPYLFEESGTYNFVAKYDELTSNTITFEVESPSEFSDTSSFSPTGSPTNFTKKVLLEETTGTWCSSCPDGAYYMSQVINSNPNIYGAAFHSGQPGYPDPMSIPETDFWHAYYNAFLFPTIWVNGAPEDLNYNISPQITNELAENATVGLALESAIIGGKLDLEINVGFDATPNEQLQLIILLIEGSDTAPDSPQQGASGNQADYVHKYIVREVYSDILGDPIPATHTLSGGIYTRIITGLDFPTNVNASDHDDLSIIAYVKNAYTETWTSGSGNTFVDAPVYDIYNVQKAQLGEIVSFD